MNASMTGNTSSELSVVTAETRAKELGATIVFYSTHTLALNFPTNGAAKLFVQWLDDRGYNIINVANDYPGIEDRTSVAYTMPNAVAHNVHILERN